MERSGTPGRRNVLIDSAPVGAEEAFLTRRNMKQRWLQRIWLMCLSGSIRLRGKQDTLPPDTPDWTGNASRLGVRFTERLRDLWRPRWLNLHRRDEEN